MKFIFIVHHFCKFLRSYLVNVHSYLDSFTFISAGPGLSNSRSNEAVVYYRRDNRNEKCWSELSELSNSLILSLLGYLGTRWYET